MEVIDHDAAAAAAAFFHRSNGQGLASSRPLRGSCHANIVSRMNSEGIMYLVPQSVARKDKGGEQGMEKTGVPNRN